MKKLALAGLIVALVWSDAPAQVFPFFPPPGMQFNAPTAQVGGSNVSISTAVAAISTVTLSGLQTIDGYSLVDGETVLVTSNSGTVGCTGGSPVNNCLDGIYVVHTGAWNRSPLLPNGATVPAGSDVIFLIRHGTNFAGATFELTTTSSFVVNNGSMHLTQTFPQASRTNPGPVKVTDAASDLVVNLAGTVPHLAFDCADFTTTNGGIGDDGNVASTTGSCIVADVNGNPILNGTGSAPTVTGTGCSLTAGGRNATGSIVATGADTCTLTFAGAFTTAPNCTVSGVGATVIPFLNALPTTAHAIFQTTAAGTFTYLCL